MIGGVLQCKGPDRSRPNDEPCSDAPEFCRSSPTMSGTEILIASGERFLGGSTVMNSPPTLMPLTNKGWDQVNKKA